ncbi:hypothetical protein VNO77_14170 [Canavalia gladiata]|uniref:Uncharacterized protein n=1 Tax=Canavalia gladiata TaxID=3824 RepID=A0AAN9LYG8_CANGL
MRAHPTCMGLALFKWCREWDGRLGCKDPVKPKLEVLIVARRVPAPVANGKDRQTSPNLWHEVCLGCMEFHPFLCESFRSVLSSTAPRTKETIFFHVGASDPLVLVTFAYRMTPFEDPAGPILSDQIL